MHELLLPGGCKAKDPETSTLARTTEKERRSTSLGAATLQVRHLLRLGIRIVEQIGGDRRSGCPEVDVKRARKHSIRST